MGISVILTEVLDPSLTAFEKKNLIGMSAALDQLFDQKVFATPAYDDKEFRKWKELVSTTIVQDAAREAEIYSVCPLGYDSSRLYRDYAFSEGCQGENDQDDMRSFDNEGVEKFCTRIQTIEAVFKVIQQRKALADANDSINRDDFRSIVEKITELRLLVTHEYTEHSPDHDIYYPDRHQFEPWLQRELLFCFANRLTSLHLSFQENWGVTPGYFDRKGLHFPSLKSLSLGEYVIGRHDQFDWVLAQTRLETLCLNRCIIVSYLHFDDLECLEWGIPARDWKRVPDAFNFEEESKTYIFSGTWEVVFDRIRLGLSRLVQFRMQHRDGGERCLSLADEMSCQLTAQRYTCFGSGILPIPWLEADFTGTLEFARIYGRLDVLEEDIDDDEEDPELNRAKETKEGDMRAFKRLLQGVEERARRGF
ncbi:hypothetical protein QBC36DRAFT_304942 [Triangularia setosa]|uniref:Uncharacterized protein n=1 Tax=Triangularia setosa TaxID=2587417 RepID=A0AAN7A3C4_9PEZI|nr:hypothetical protein QBC36DRAFT_304942 [Podospora setosa]